MTNALVAAIEGKKIITRTTNGAVTNATSGSRLLDLFGQAGAMRGRSESDIISLFTDAFNEDKLLAVRTAFWTRDARGGAGERRTFRVILKWLAINHPSIVRKNIVNVADYGRYDDLVTLLGTPVEADVIKFIQGRVVEDLKSQHPSLLAKWLPSINTSSKETKRNGRKIAKALNLSEKQYRQVLSKLRKQINVVERLMCAREWDSINYEQVTSKAAMNYRKAFRKNDEARYNEYIAAVVKGEKTIKATTLFPYDLVRAVWPMSGREADIATLDAQWNALPNYFEGTDFVNWMAVVDVSDSMRQNNKALPMYTSIGLGIYCAERAKGPFHNKYITFSARPQLLTVTGKNIWEKVNHTRRTGVGYNTNLQAVFDLILNTAINHRIAQSELPDTLVILTDTQFDHPQVGSKDTNFEVIKQKFANAGYKMPRLVFWNVNAIKDDASITVNDDGVVMVSGHSASIFKSLIENKPVNALTMFLATVNAERYSKIVV